MSNTDTELRKQLIPIIEDYAAMSYDNSMEFNPERGATQLEEIVALIQARDTAHKAALLQAVGALEATCETCDGKGVMEQQTASSEWQETETWPCEEPIHQTRQAIATILPEEGRK